MPAFSSSINDSQRRLFEKDARTLTVDAGCEFGTNSSVSAWGHPRQTGTILLGFTYQRFWFHKDLFDVTVGEGAINNATNQKCDRNY
jgi:hypothetical protein